MILRGTLFLLRCSIGAIAGSRKSYTGPAKDVRSCPNHHVLFDDGAITLADDLTVIGLIPQRKLAIKHQVHQVAIEYLRYHREHFGVLVESHP